MLSDWVVPQKKFYRAGGEPPAGRIEVDEHKALQVEPLRGSKNHRGTLDPGLTPGAILVQPFQGCEGKYDEGPSRFSSYEAKFCCQIACPAKCGE